jgi:hypothetical protein
LSLKFFRLAPAKRQNLLRPIRSKFRNFSSKANFEIGSNKIHLKEKQKMADREEYGKMLTDLIQKQMVIFGPNIALGKARKVAGLKVDNAGAVLDISGDPQMVLKSAAGEYESLSGPIAQMTLNSVLGKYPGVKM